MSIDVNGTILSSAGNNLLVTDGSNKLFQQLSNGITLLPKSSSDTQIIPFFNVGINGGGAWRSWTAATWQNVQFNYTGGSGYYNVNNCFNTSTYAFTAPITGFYLFKSHCYIYYPDGSGYSYYVHPLFAVNGSNSARRPGTHYRIRLYGLFASYGQDTDISEIIYLYAGDYVHSMVYAAQAIQYYGDYCSFNGTYLGS